jgi:transketolase C-terminal domain/subunit
VASALLHVPTIKPMDEPAVGRSDQLLGKYRLSAARVAEDVERLLRFQGQQKG